MRAFLAAFIVEIKKTIKSKIFIGSLGLSVFIAFMVGLLFFIVKNPEFAQASAIIRAKATIVGNADWQTFTDVVCLLLSILGIIGFGFLTSWIFGREYVDKTLKDLLSLPVSRHNIVIAKFSVIFFWCFLVAIVIFLFSMLTGFWVGLEKWSAAIIINGLKRYIVVMLMNIVLTTIVAFLASYRRGYILPLAFLFLVLLISNFAINISENARYIPWAVPLLYAGATLKEGMGINTASIIVLLVTGIIGFVGTISFLRYADQY
ncbi:MAG: ABC transporter permease [Brevinematia bacterium]